MGEIVLTTRELAQRWKMTVDALKMMRYRKQGPAYRKYGKAIRYNLEDVKRYELEIRCSTAEQE